MDGIANALNLVPSVFTHVDINDIDLSGIDMRRTTAPAIRDAALVASITRRGVLQPVGIRPLDPPVDGKSYQVAFGRRRIRCATLAGLTRIPAHVARWTDDEVAAIMRVENMVRSEPHPIDRWCAVSDLVDAGFTVAEAAAELGLDERESRQMERLGRLHPSLLALAEIQMPHAAHLRVIANAPRKTQQAAGKGRDVVTDIGGRRQVSWSTIAQRCAVRRIPQRHAIFDVARHAAIFTEDLFAEPGDPDAISTDQVARFMELQQEALEARVAERRAAGQRVEWVPIDANGWSPALPKGFRSLGAGSARGAKPKKTETVFTAICGSGAIVEVLAVHVAAQKAAEKKREERRKVAATIQAAETGDDADDTPELGRTPTGPRVSKKSLDIIARAKTTALRARLLAWAKGAETDQVLSLMILALCADNVDLHPSDARPRDLAAQLILPGGQMAQLPAETIRVMAASALARLLTISGPNTLWKQGSGVAAEWIGAAIGAGASLDRFDTPEFLAETPLAVLKELAVEGKVGSWVKGAAALREALPGRLPDWRPEAAAFGAPGPTMKDHAHD